MTRKIQRLEDHVNELQEARERIIHLVEEQRANGNEIKSDVLNWLQNVDELIERANQHFGECGRANVRSSTWRFPNLILRHKLNRNAMKIAKKVIQVQGKGMFDSIGYPPTLDGVASSSSTRASENYESRESLKDDILTALADLNSCNIGVNGMGGVGKTTLVTEVALAARQHKLFDKVVITNVSMNPDLKMIQEEIADLLGLRFEEETILGRAHRLRQRIKMEKSILVILDDIWTMFDLRKVGIPFGNEHNGCKLLMTSRNQDVLLQMDVPKDFAFKLEHLSEYEAWKLFQLMAGDVVKDNNWKDVVFQVAQKSSIAEEDDYRERLDILIRSNNHSLRENRECLDILIRSNNHSLRYTQEVDEQEVDGETRLSLWVDVAGGVSGGQHYSTTAMSVNLRPSVYHLSQESSPLENEEIEMLRRELAAARAEAAAANERAAEGNQRADVSDQRINFLENNMADFAQRMTALENQSSGGSYNTSRAHLTPQHPHYADDLDDQPSGIDSTTLLL